MSGDWLPVIISSGDVAVLFGHGIVEVVKVYPWFCVPCWDRRTAFDVLFNSICSLSLPTCHKPTNARISRQMISICTTTDLLFDGLIYSLVGPFICHCFSSSYTVNIFSTVAVQSHLYLYKILHRKCRTVSNFGPGNLLHCSNFSLRPLSKVGRAVSISWGNSGFMPIVSSNGSWWHMEQILHAVE